MMEFCYIRFFLLFSYLGIDGYFVNNFFFLPHLIKYILNKTKKSITHNIQNVRQSCIL